MLSIPTTKKLDKLFKYCRSCGLKNNYTYITIQSYYYRCRLVDKQQFETLNDLVMKHKFCQKLYDNYNSNSSKPSKPQSGGFVPATATEGRVIKNILKLFKQNGFIEDFLFKLLVSELEKENV